MVFIDRNGHAFVFYVEPASLQLCVEGIGLNGCASWIVYLMLIVIE